MNTDASFKSSLINRRRLLRGISAIALLLATPCAVAEKPALPSLRALAGGKPLMGTSVQIQFDEIYTP